MADASERIREHRERKEKLEIAAEEARALLSDRRQFLDSADTIAAFAAEVVNGNDYFDGRAIPIRRTGRDMPGSNWHTYVWDPDENVNELYYGIEQIGWLGRSKPRPMHYRGFQVKPELPQMSEEAEVVEALDKGIEIFSGYKDSETLPANFDVDGILLPRPFKITKIGPVNLFVGDPERALEFYTNHLGFVHTEEVNYRGHKVVFLRNGSEHHSLGLFPKALRAELGCSSHTSCMSFGVEVATYQQLRNAVEFLKQNGVQFREIPEELHPGVDYAAYAIDPDGHMIQLYYYMEQVGWDGKPRPAELRHQATVYPWRIKKPLPGSGGPSGSLSGALLKFLKAEFFPRFKISKNSLRFPRPWSTGAKIRKSEENSTNPCPFLGANFMSAMVSLAALSGSTAK